MTATEWHRKTQNNSVNYKGATGVHRNNTEKTSVKFCEILWLN